MASCQISAPSCVVVAKAHVDDFGTVVYRMIYALYHDAIGAVLVIRIQSYFDTLTGITLQFQQAPATPKALSVDAAAIPATAVP